MIYRISWFHNNCYFTNCFATAEERAEFRKRLSEKWHIEEWEN